MSDTTVIFEDKTNHAFFFDASKSEGQQFSDLNKQVGNFYRLSDTTGIFKENKTNQGYLLEYK